MTISFAKNQSWLLPISTILVISFLLLNEKSSEGRLIRNYEIGSIPGEEFRFKRESNGQNYTEHEGVQSEPRKLAQNKNSANSEEADEETKRKWRPAELYELVLPPNYNKHIIPKHKSGRPMKVYIQINIRKILDLDEKEESMKIDAEFRVSWTDYKIREYFNEKREAKGLKRISFDELTPQQKKNMTKTLNDPKMLDAIWKPNLFFGNLLKVTQPYPMSLPVQLKLIPDIGQFMYLTRISVQTDCPMTFYYYPADTQDCFFSIQDFSYTQRDLELAWQKSGVWLNELEVSSFDVKVGKLEETTRVEDDEDELSDSFDVFTFRIKSRRRLSYHVVQTYLPSTFYIIITCLCFLLPARLIEARIGIAMTTLLTLTAMFASVRESTPIVSYVKAIDIWMAGCIMFVFLTLAEFTFITWLRSIKEDYVPVDKAEEEGNDVERADLFSRKSSASHVSYMSRKKIKNYENLMTFLEKYNFPMFMGLLVVFSFIYWAWLLHGANYYDWKIHPEHNNLAGISW